MKLSLGVTVAILATTITSFVHRNPRGNVTNALEKRVNEPTRNWAGAAVPAAPDDSGFVAVIATFVVPTIDTATMTPGTGVTLWVGIDGYEPERDNPIIQAGIDVEYVDDDELIYKAFTEWVDGSEREGPVRVDGIDVTGGDTVTVEVTGRRGDTQATAIFTINGVQEEPETFYPDLGPLNTIKGNNLEWAVERLPGPGNRGGSPTLLNFGSITLMDCSGSTARTAASTTPQNGNILDMEGSNGQGFSATTTLVGSDRLDIVWLMG